MAIVSSWCDIVESLAFLESLLRCTNCLVKSSNERDPYAQLLIFPPGEMHPVWTARVKWEEGEGDGRSVWSESHGLHRVVNKNHRHDTLETFLNHRLDVLL